MKYSNVVQSNPLLKENSMKNVKLFFRGALLDSVKPFTGQTCAFFSYSKAQNKKKKVLS